MDPEVRSLLYKMQVEQANFPNRATSWGNFISFPKAQYSADYAATKIRQLKSVFFHEFYHEFEYRLGVASPFKLLINQISSGFG